MTNQFAANVVFTPTRCLLQAATLQRAVILGNQEKGLYFLQQNSKLQAAVGDIQSSDTHLSGKPDGFTFACFSDAELWYFRVGHLPFEQLKYVDGYICNNGRQHNICQICPMAKMHRSGFPLSTSRAKDIFDLLHVDICGPSPHSTCDGAKFFLTIVDDCSKATWVHLMAHKSNALSLLRAFLIFVKTQFGATVKVIRSDNGLEFKDKLALDFYKEKDIIHQTSCVDTPNKWGC